MSFSAVGLLLGFFIKGHHLKTEHQVTQTGLEAMAKKEEQELVSTEQSDQVS